MVIATENWRTRLATCQRSEQARFRHKLQRAYDQPMHPDAKWALSRIPSELRVLNASAVGTSNEGFEETLTLRRRDLFEALG